MFVGMVLIYGIMGGIFIVKCGMANSPWWNKCLFAFCITFVFTVIKGLIMSKVNKRKNEKDKKSEGMKKECNGVDNKLLNNFWINKLVKFIINIILVLLIYLVVGIEFGYFEAIYCEPTDSESNNNVNSNKDNKITSENKDVKGKEADSYNITANVGKGMIKEAVEGAVEGISNAIPTAVGGMVGGSLGVAVINASKSLPPLQKAIIGVVTAAAGAFSVSTATGLAKELVKTVSNSKEDAKPLSVSSVSNNKLISGDNGKDDFIASVLENGDELSPLQMILNYEIILGILILVHMGLVILIWLHKLYVSSVLTILSKFFSQKTITKYAKFKEKIEKIGSSYLIILIIINVMFILFDLCIIIYANVELSNNIDAYIDLHLKMNKSIIMLLFVKFNFIANKHKMEQNKSFNTWSKAENKNRNNLMEGLDLNELNQLNLESEDKDVRYIIGVENVTRNNLISSENNVTIISTEEIEKNIMSLPCLSEKIINKNIVKEWDTKNNKERELKIKTLDENFKNIVIYLKISSCYITKKNYFKLVNILLEKLTELGVDREYFKKLEKILRTWKKDFKKIDQKRKLKDNPIFDKYFDVFIELSEIIQKKNANINLSIWNDFIQLFETSEKFNLAELTKINDKILDKLKLEYKDISEKDFFKEHIKRKKRNSGDTTEIIMKYFKDSDYQKILDSKLLDLLNELKKEQMELLTNKNIEWVNDLSKLIDSIVDFISQIFEDILFEIFDTGYIAQNYSDNPNIIKKVNKKNKELALELFEEQKTSDLSVLLDNIKNIESMKISKDKLSKWNAGNNSLFNIIEKIFKLSESNKEKQIALEKAIFEYETNFFLQNMETVSNEIKIYSQEYSNISTNYGNLINDYTKYRSIKLKKLFNKDKINAIIILMLIYTNKDKNISLIFKFILNAVFFNKQYMNEINKTVLLFQLAKYFINIIILNKEDINVFESVKIICSYSDLKDLIKKFDDSDLLKLGDTLYSLVAENSKLLETELRTISKTSKESIVKINSIYLNKLISSNMSFSLLPMVSKPKDVDINGDYYPYLLNNTNVLGIEECKVIKGKYNQRYYTKGSKQFYEGINSINNIKFKINNDMLNFVLYEWSFKESIFFKGYNVFKEIYAKDSTEIKKEKFKHNALFSLYYNIIQIAVLFRDQTFYLPVYADFRGRIYTLSNYLSYQGNDLARSLLLFDREEYLNSEGLEFLRIYFTNLAGLDKLSWNDRLNKHNEVWRSYNDAVIEYVKDKSKDKIDKFLSNISEPFQLHSIGLAIYNYNESTNKEKFIINNPILFDASCSGIQHISALTLDKNLATYSNVFTDKLNPLAEKPEDFYMYALSLINDKLLNSYNPNIKNIKLKRNIIKRTVMTIPYNISLTGIGEQLEEHFKKVWKINKFEFIIPAELSVNEISFSITSKEFGIFTKLVYDVLTKEIPSLKTLTNYFKNIINVLNTLKLPINWETPAGLNIKYQQIKFKSKAVKNNLIQGSKAITISTPTNEINKVKMLRSFMPNFIHSLDASNVHLLINYISKDYNISFYTIHDCFASTPNKMGLLANIVKRAFIYIYFKDEGYLLKTHKNFILEIKNNFEIIIENDKEYIEFINSKKEKEYIELPQLPKEFQNNNLKDFAKGLKQSKYFIG